MRSLKTGYPSIFEIQGKRVNYRLPTHRRGDPRNFSMIPSSISNSKILPNGVCTSVQFGLRGLKYSTFKIILIFCECLVLNNSNFSIIIFHIEVLIQIRAI